MQQRLCYLGRNAVQAHQKLELWEEQLEGISCVSYHVNILRSALFKSVRPECFT